MRADVVRVLSCVLCEFHALAECLLVERQEVVVSLGECLGEAAEHCIDGNYGSSAE